MACQHSFSCLIGQRTRVENRLDQSQLEGGTMCSYCSTGIDMIDCWRQKTQKCQLVSCSAKECSIEIPVFRFLRRKI